MSGRIAASSSFTKTSGDAASDAPRKNSAPATPTEQAIHPTAARATKNTHETIPLVTQ
jgi:hypothetical protein